jgi:hypothetical protein
MTEPISLQRLLWLGPLTVISAVLAVLLVRVIASMTIDVPPDFIPLQASALIVFTTLLVAAGVVVFAGGWSLDDTTNPELQADRTGGSGLVNGSRSSVVTDARRDLDARLRVDGDARRCVVANGDVALSLVMGPNRRKRGPKSRPMSVKEEEAFLHLPRTCDLLVRSRQ